MNKGLKLMAAVAVGAVLIASSKAEVKADTWMPTAEWYESGYLYGGAALDNAYSAYTYNPYFSNYNPYANNFAYSPYGYGYNPYSSAVKGDMVPLASLMGRSAVVTSFNGAVVLSNINGHLSLTLPDENSFVGMSYYASHPYMRGYNELKEIDPDYALAVYMGYAIKK